MEKKVLLSLLLFIVLSSFIYAGDDTIIIKKYQNVSNYYVNGSSGVSSVQSLDSYLVVANGSTSNFSLNYSFLTSQLDLLYYGVSNPPRLDEIGNPSASKIFTMGGNTVTWLFNNPVGGMLWNLTGGWSGHVLEIHDDSSVPTGSDGDHLLHIESDRANVIPAHFMQSAGRTSLKVDGNIVNNGSINIMGNATITNLTITFNGVNTTAKIPTNGNLCWTDDSMPFMCMGQDDKVNILTGGRISQEGEDILPTSESWGKWEDDYSSTVTHKSFWIGAGITGAVGTILAGTVADINHPGQLSYRSLANTPNSGYYSLTNAATIIINGSESSTHIFKCTLATSNWTVTRMGFQDVATVADSVDAIYTRLIVNTTNAWVQGVTRNNSVESTTANYTIDCNNWYKTKIYVNSTGTGVNFSIYNSSDTTNSIPLLWNATLTTNIPVGSARVTGHGEVAYAQANTTLQTIVTFDYRNVKIGRKLLR